MFEVIGIGLIIVLILFGIYFYWIYRTSKNYGKKGNNKN